MGNTMTLKEKQFEFANMVSALIHFAIENGYNVTLGDAYRSPECSKLRGKLGAKSLHCLRLAIDLNLFSRDGRWLRKTEDHADLGEHWEAMGGTWGGRFKSPDGNHYQFDGVARNETEKNAKK